MGVEPISPGAQKIKIHPKIGNLSYVRLKTSFISGDVLVSCKQSQKGFTLEVGIPGGVKADLILPANKGAQRIYHNGSVLDLKISNKKYHLSDVSAGKHLIEIK